jgi:hypothetical protein
MIQGILKSRRLEAGLSEPEWKKSVLYEPSYKMAQEIAREMNNSSVIADFRAFASKIQLSFMDRHLEGPTGDRYRVTRESFMSSYPNFLQSYEIGLIGQTTIETVSQYPSVEVLGHYHDGNVLAIPTKTYGEVLKFMK